MSASIVAAAPLMNGQVPLGEAVAVWVLGPIALAGGIGMVLLRNPIALAGGIGMVLLRNAVHSALSLAATMMALGAMYVVEQGPFIGLVQIIVYTGAIMILFLFVLMLVGRDSSDSLVETLRGQRWAAALAGVAFALLVALTIGRAFRGIKPVNLDAANQGGTNVNSLAELIFTKYLFAFELTSALLIVASRTSNATSRNRPRRRSPRHASAPGVRSRCRGRACSRRVTPSERPRCCPTARSRPSRSWPRRPVCASDRRCQQGRPTNDPRRFWPPRRLFDAGRPKVCAIGGRPVTPTYYLVLSAALFTIGAAGVLVRRNAIVVFMCIELMLNAVNLTLVTFSRINGSLDGQVIAFFVMVVAAAEVVVGLAIIMSIFRTRRSASVDDANLLKY